MTKMDDEIHPECDVYVEDERAKLMLQEIIFKLDSSLMDRINITPFGAAGVGRALGHLVTFKKFTRPSVVFLEPGTKQMRRAAFVCLEMMRQELSCILRL